MTISEVIYFSNINSDELSDCTPEEFQSLIKKVEKEENSDIYFVFFNFPIPNFADDSGIP